MIPPFNSQTRKTITHTQEKNFPILTKIALLYEIALILVLISYKSIHLRWTQEFQVGFIKVIIGQKSLIYSLAFYHKGFEGWLKKYLVVLIIFKFYIFDIAISKLYKTKKFKDKLCFLDRDILLTGIHFNYSNSFIGIDNIFDTL